MKNEELVKALMESPNLRNSPDPNILKSDMAYGMFEVAKYQRENSLSRIPPLCVVALMVQLDAPVRRLLTTDQLIQFDNIVAEARSKWEEFTPYSAEGEAIRSALRNGDVAF